MRRIYDDDLKRNAEEKVLGGQIGISVARDLDVVENLFYKWKKQFLQNGDGVRATAGD